MLCKDHTACEEHTTFASKYRNKRRKSWKKNYLSLIHISTESLEAHFDVSKEVVETEEVSDNIMAAIREKRSILKNERTTHLDMWISYLAFIFDLNFASSFGYIQEHDYLSLIHICISAWTFCMKKDY